MSNFAEKEQANLQAALLGLSLDPGAASALHVQLTEGLRALILSGQAAPGGRLPASRTLAAELSISRSTVLAALDQLGAEGYLVTRVGAGTYVTPDLPRMVVAPMPSLPEEQSAPTPGARAFHPALPDMDAFPHAAWARHLNRAWRQPDQALLAEPDPMGWMPLRRAIAAHLAAWRGITCAPGQVAITSGVREAISLIAALLPRGGNVLTEEPGFAPVRQGLAAAGLNWLALAVDEQGFDIAQAGTQSAAGVVVTPSRHYPLGMTMPLARRMSLLDWAQRQDALIVEDDYDSEFRYSGPPVPALMSLDAGGRVIYAGSFSKLLSPALRLGYLVVPARLLPGFRAVLQQAGSRASLVPQPALAGFMQSGGFATHLRRMRRLYAKRQKLLLAELEQKLPGWLETRPDPTGMHLVCRFGPMLAGKHDSGLAQAGQAAGLILQPLSGYFTTPDPPQGLVLGFAGFDEVVLKNGVETLSEVLRAL